MRLNNVELISNFLWLDQLVFGRPLFSFIGRVVHFPNVNLCRSATEDPRRMARPPGFPHPPEPLPWRLVVTKGQCELGRTYGGIGAGGSLEALIAAVDTGYQCAIFWFFGITFVTFQFFSQVCMPIGALNGCCRACHPSSTKRKCRIQMRSTRFPYFRCAS